MLLKHNERWSEKKGGAAPGEVIRTDTLTTETRRKDDTVQKSIVHLIIIIILRREIAKSHRTRRAPHLDIEPQTPEVYVPQV